MFLGFIACSDDDDDDDKTGINPTKLEASNVVGAYSTIARVEIKLIWQDGNGYAGGSTTIADAPYKNGFSLELPEILGYKYLFPVKDILPEGITVSNKDAKISDEIITIDALDADGKYVGDICYASINEKKDRTVIVSRVYADRDVTIEGKYTDIISGYIDIYDNVSLKAGWNVFYGIVDRNGMNTTSTVTMQKPSGEDFKWYFED